MNTSDRPLSLLRAERRVLEIQAKLHRWANDDPHRRFDDLFNLVTDPGFLLMAWERVAGNKGARSAGVDGVTAVFVSERIGTDRLLTELREQLRDRTFRPVPVRERFLSPSSLLSCGFWAFLVDVSPGSSHRFVVFLGIGVVGLEEGAGVWSSEKHWAELHD